MGVLLAAARAREAVTGAVPLLVLGTLGITAMNAAAALGALLSGPLMAVLGFPALATLGGAVVVPVLWLVWRGAHRTPASG